MAQLLGAGAQGLVAEQETGALFQHPQAFGGAVAGDHIPEDDAWHRLLRDAGMGAPEIENRPDLFFLSSAVPRTEEFLPDLGDDAVLQLYRNMVRMRAFDDKALKLQRQGRMVGKG